MKILFLTLEFADPVFSGNGIWGRSLVRGLLQFKESLHVTVVCGGPIRNGDLLEPPVPWPEASEAAWGQRLEVRVVGLPLWGRLDRGCSWSEYAAHVANEFASATQPEGDHPLPFDLVLGLDWHSYFALEALEQARAALPPYVFLNVRVFSANPGLSDEDRAWYRAAEAKAIRRASSVIAQTQRDADLLGSLLDPETCPEVTSVAPRIALHCPLREDLRQLAIESQVDEGDTAKRKYLLCVSRLSPEKNLEAFIGAIEGLGVEELRKAGIIPLLMGAKMEPAEYSDSLLERFKAACPFAEYGSFRPPSELAKIYQQTRLYFHAALQEPYGMSPVEAAAFGVPALMNEDGIGSAERLRPSHGESLAAPMKDPLAVAEVLKDTLTNSSRLAEVGQRARARALEWSEGHFAAAVMEELEKTQVQVGA
mmetsp:Transcript_2325/g.4872  ORF Transcript_2325/g.4872 Transcript_2325/m.4872 type:complete len:424 (+) Transcript_2325:69-1340(+)